MERWFRFSSRGWRRGTIGVLTAICWMCLPEQTFPAQSKGPEARIPSAGGTTLAGTAVALPDALKGKVGILVVGFSQASQGPVEGWGRRLAADYRGSAGVAYYEIAMLQGAPKLLRGMIVHAMKSSVPEPERPHFLTLTEGDAAWRAVAHYSKPDDAYVLLVDADGVVRWQTEGNATDSAYAALKHGLEALSMPPAAH